MPSDAPFPHDSAIDPALQRRVKEALRRNAVQAGVRKPTKKDLRDEAKAADKARGWRVVVPGNPQSVGPMGILGVDPGAAGGWAWWGWHDGWHFENAGDGLPATTFPYQFDALVILEDQHGFRPHVDKATGKLKRGGSVSEHAAGRHWGEAYGVLSTVCRERGWPMVVVQAKTWQAMTRPFPGHDTKRRAANWLAMKLGLRDWLALPWDPWWGPKRTKVLDGRVDAACIAAWATLPGVLPALAAAWQGEGTWAS